MEAEHKAARQMYERLGKYGYSKMYFGYVPEVPYLPHTSQRGSTDSAEEFLIIRYQAIDYGHDNRPLPEDWYPDRAGLNEWRASLTNADVTIRYLSQGQYGLGFNCDYGLFILAKEHGEWVWPNKAQLNLAYQSIVKANIPEKDVVIHIKPANTRGSDAYRRWWYKDPLYWNATGLYTNRKERLFNSFVDDVRASKEPVLYFVAGSDNKTRKSLVDGRELLATSLTPADILCIARNRGITMPTMVVEKALPGQRGLLVRTNLIK